MLIAIAMAYLSGVTRISARMVNAQLSECLGALQSTFCNYAVGLICSLLALGLSRGPMPVSALTSGHIPPWAYGGGVVGVVLVVLSNRITSRMSAVAMTVLVVAGQLATGLVIDSFLRHEVSLAKVAGSGLIVLGLVHHRCVEQKRKRQRA